MKRKKYDTFLLMVALAFVCSGCSFEKYGRDLTAGAASQAGAMGHNLVAGVRDELASPVTRARMSAFLDSLVSNLSDTVAVKAGRIEDSLLNQKAFKWADSLVATVSGNRLRVNAEALQAALIGKTKRDVLEMRDGFSQLLNEILSSSTRSKAGLLRDELLGTKTITALTRILDTSVNHVIDSSMKLIALRLRNDINPILKEDTSFIQKHGMQLLIALAVLSAAIIILVWRNRQKYLRMLMIVTKHVHDIPDQNIYDEVTSQIKRDTITAGIEPDLRALLAKNGLISNPKAPELTH